MKPVLLIIAFVMGYAAATAQCPASGTQIEHAWINPAGTYLDLGSKRPLNGVHHKIFDLTTNKFVATGINIDAYPLRGFGFVIETDTRFRISDFTNWSANSTKIWVSKDGKDVINKTFTKHAHVFYDTAHGRGLITEPTDGSDYRLYYLQEGSEPQLLDKRYRGSTSNGSFSPDGRYAVLGGGTVIDMNTRKVLARKLDIKKWVPWATIPVISTDSRYVALIGRLENTARNQTVTVFDLETREMVRQLVIPDSLNSAYSLKVYPVPDMRRAVVVVQRNQNGYYETGTAYILSESGLEALCYPGWRRERDEYLGKTTTVYNDVAAEKGACPMDVAAMEADGKWKLTIDGQRSVLYLSARASGEVSGTYTYTKGTESMKGKLSGKLTASKDGAACTHRITGSFDESLFGGGTGTFTLTLGSGGKSILGKAGSSTWSGEKD